MQNLVRTSLQTFFISSFSSFLSVSFSLPIFFVSMCCCSRCFNMLVFKLLHSLLFLTLFSFFSPLFLSRSENSFVLVIMQDMLRLYQAPS